MASPAVQWSIDQLYSGLQNLKAGIDRIATALEADRQDLIAAYNDLRAHATDAAYPNAKAALDQQTHRNSVLRISYLSPLRAKFTQAVNASSAFLKSHGYTTPGLSGLGAVVVAPAAAVAIVVVAIATVATVWALTQAQRERTAQVTQAIKRGWTPAQIDSLIKQQTEQIKGEPPPLGIDLGTLVPIAFAVAAIVLGPRLLELVPRRARA